jgi:TonB-dependent SusC/RagA subfamily outer membrane receptor
VTAQEIQPAPDRSLDQMLLGRFPGVMVMATAGGGISVRIRGISSFYSSNEPLYVLDGIPVRPGPNGSFGWLNPYDIASIEVLKDPAETGIYGVRGANGVIVIKTKGAARLRH